MEKLKWLFFANEEGFSVNKQHAFKPVESEIKYSEEKFIGNKSLCGKFRISEDGENSLPFSELDSHKLFKNEACKHCLKASQNL